MVVTEDTKHKINKAIKSLRKNRSDEQIASEIGITKRTFEKMVYKNTLDSKHLNKIKIWIIKNVPVIKK